MRTIFRGQEQSRITAVYPAGAVVANDISGFADPDYDLSLEWIAANTAGGTTTARNDRSSRTSGWWRSPPRSSSGSPTQADYLELTYM